MEQSSIKRDIKILVIGNPRTGKTNYANKYNKGLFNDEYKATVVSEFNFKIFELNGFFYRILIWDITGQDKKKYEITKIFAKDSQGCIILADATDPKSREE